MQQKGRRIYYTVVITVLVVLFASAGTVATFYTDLLWYRDLGQQGVFWTTLLSKLVTRIAFAVVAFAVLYLNARVARKMAPKRLLTVVGVNARLEEVLGQVRDVLGRFAGWIVLAVCGVLALGFGAAMADHWQELRLALAAVPFGATDPQFGKDIGFFFFTLPAYRLITSWAMGLLAAALLLSTVVHVFEGGIRPWDRLKGFDPHVKAHLSVLMGLIVLTQAFSYYLDIFELNYSPRGQVIGASYTDVHAQIPAYTILIVVALLSGIALLVNIRVRGWKLPAVALGVWIGAAILVGSIYPALVQQFRVSPNEVAAEAPYLERNIAATRAAYDLDTIEVREFDASESLTATDVASNTQTVENVRLWDPAIVAQSYRQLQGIRPYYDFIDVDIDRYVIDGKRKEVLISARELDVSQLAEQARTWVNEHLVYTHGYGVVVSPVNEVTGGGLPDFIVRDIPPTSNTDLVVSQPGIYFGERTTNYVVAATDLEEFDYPIGDQNATTSFEGEAGIPAGGVMQRVAFAIRFGAPQLVLSQYIRADSKILFRRALSDRIEALAPWLAIDGDPYMVIADGRLIWVIDGYTTSDRYPYSEPAWNGGVNYVRNSVKITVDAYDGTTIFYAFDPTDPVLQAWRTIFPELLVDGDEMPDDIRAHLRYPEDLFSMQAEVYKTYHMLDPRVFYNKEDQWALPGEQDGQPMDPFYVLMRLPEDETEDFMLMLPFTPRNKDNMIGWMAAKSDPQDYGTRVAYRFPKQRLILGPDQVSARVNQDPVISQQLSLWNQRGSGVLFGNLLVIPMNKSIVYIQPLYLQAEQTAIPQLTRVIVAFADKVAMEPDLATALKGVFGTAGGTTDGTADGGTEPVSGIVEGEDLATALDLYERAIEAQRAGDWAAYGRYMDELGALLESAVSAGSTVTTTSP